jgi:nitroreductase
VATRADQSNWKKLLECLVQANQTWAKNAPVLMLTAAKRAFSLTGKPNYHALHDTGMALANLMLQATSMGLAAHAMAGFDHDKSRAVLGIPDDYDLGAAVAIGYPGDPASLPPGLQATEIAPRSRNPLSDFVFSAVWGQPITIPFPAVTMRVVFPWQPRSFFQLSMLTSSLFGSLSKVSFRN